MLGELGHVLGEIVEEVVDDIGGEDLDPCWHVQVSEVFAREKRIR